jgi:hypothetical protein
MQEPALCQLSVVPVRSGASDKDEIVTQLLFGELVDILEISRAKKNWCHIRCAFDSYEGWVDMRQLLRINPNDLNQYQANQAFCLDLTATLTNNNHFLPITMGAILPNFDGINLRLGDKHYTFNGQAFQTGLVKTSADIVLKLARRYLYAPYLWGGKSPFGIDCSGFTQTVFRMAGMRLRRDASQQIEQGRTIDFVEQAQAGDLAFFENERGRIVHVGILISEHEIIHASGQVRIDRLDHYGIFNEERGLYSHKLRLIKRLLPDSLPKAKPIVLETAEETANQISLF